MEEEPVLKYLLSSEQDLGYYISRSTSKSILILESLHFDFTALLLFPFHIAPTLDLSEPLRGMEKHFAEAPLFHFV